MSSLPNGELVGQGTAFQEGLFSLGCGILYGSTSVLVGHPLDTIKTKMQAQREFGNLGMFRSAAQIFRKNGVSGFYRGALPPLCGSLVFRSLQFASYGAVFAGLRGSWFERHSFLGVEYRVLVGGVASGICRGAIESPLELIKIRRQMGLPWDVRDLVVGARATGGISSTLAWSVVWPIDVVKSRVQAGDPKGIVAILGAAARGGTLYKGFVPGALRSFVANGAAMYAYQFGQSHRNVVLRDDQLS